MLSRETGRLTAMVERLLEWARMEAGKRVVPARARRRRRRGRCGARGARLAGQAERPRGHHPRAPRASPIELPLVDVDPEAMSEALLNVMSNALRYTPRQEGDRGALPCSATRRWSSPSPTTGRASHTTSSRASSRSSIASSIRRCPTSRARGSGWRWCTTSCARTAGASPCRASSARAPRSTSCCRWRSEQAMMAETVLVVEDDPVDLARAADEPRPRGLPTICAHDGEEGAAR